MSGEKWEYGTIGLYGIDFLIIALIGLNLVEYTKGSNFQFSIFNLQSIFNTSIFKLQNNYGLWLMAYGLLVISFLSIIWSPDKVLAFYFSCKLLLAVGLFWTVIKIKFDWKKMIVVLLLAGSIQGSLAIGQFLFQQDFSSTFLGTNQHLSEKGGSSVIETQEGRWLRAYGAFSHPNILGGYLSIVLLIVLYIEKNVAGNKVFGSRTGHKSINFKTYFLKLFLRLTAYGLCLSGLVVSFSRSAWMVFVIGFVLLFLFQKEKRRELSKIAVVFFAIALIWVSAFSPLFFSRAGVEGRLEQKSINDRSKYVEQSKEIISENFWLGVGAGNYTKVVAQKNPEQPVWQIQPVHNVFLLIWSELGIIGLILFASILLLPFFYVTENFLHYGLLITGYGLLFFDHWLWTSHFGIMFLGLIFLGLYGNVFSQYRGSLENK